MKSTASIVAINGSTLRRGPLRSSASVAAAQVGMPKFSAGFKHLRIRELKLPQEADALYPLIRLLNPKLSKRAYAGMLRSMLAQGYRCAGVFAGEEMLGACGFWIGHKFYSRKYIELDNVVVRAAERNAGIGKRLTAWVEALGRKEGCAVAMLDSYSHNHASHRFYYREGYVILGYHFTKSLTS